MLNENLQKLLSITFIILAIFLAVEAYNGIKENKYIGRNLNQIDTITVNATGEIFAKPDTAQISISVVKEAATAAEAQKQHTEAINKVVEFIKQSGVEEKNIKTSSYNIFPRYDYIENRGRVFRGYEVNQTLDIKVRNLDNVGKILSGATEAGANQISSISFVIDDEEAVKREARKQAIEKAKQKAEELKEDLNVKLLRLVNFSESGEVSPIFKSEALGVGGGPEIAPEIPAGENKITIIVSLTYEIK
ncbi:MAG: SIMPL domain-containing protein [Patescibacteria group bacterium]